MPADQPHRGSELAYVERGSGPAVCLLHGFPLDGRVWMPVATALADRFRVIVPDLTGFGKSASDQPFTIKSQADAVRSLLQTLGALPCVLAGLSMGGYIALAFATRYAADLRGLGLIDTKAEADAPAAKEARLEMVDLVRARGAKAVADQMMPKMISPYTAEHRPAVVALLRQVMESCPPKTIEHACLAMKDRDDSTAVLPTLAVPTLAVVGEDDAITPPALAEAMAEQLPHGRLARISAAGHMTPLEAPEQVAAAIREFAAGLP